MKRNELIGRVATRYLQECANLDETEGTARFILDSLTAEQTASIAQAILDDEALSNRVEIKLPLHFLQDFVLPKAILTTERATFYRHAPCDKPALLLANTGDDEGQSLKELVPIGTPQLQSHPELWVSVASSGLPLIQDHLSWWVKALNGLQNLRFLSLDRFAEYVLRTRTAIEQEGLPLLNALGHALPALRMPKDSAYFQGIKEGHRTHTHRWKHLYEAASQKRACFLTKQTPQGLLLSKDELKVSFDKVRDTIPDIIHGTILQFIDAPSGWNPASAQLAECEWEVISSLFNGMKREQFNLGQATLNFFEDTDPELLTDTEIEYLTRLVQRKTTQPEDEDINFYEAHRNQVKQERKLKSAWDRFIFGRPLETDDFLVGFALSMESLFNRQDMPSVSRRLRIRSERRTKKDLKDLNAEAGLYFATRYRGLKNLFGSQVEWDASELLSFPELLEIWKADGVEVNTSTARGALQIKFTIFLEIELQNGGTDQYQTQLIWSFKPEAVISEFANDWRRLSKHPFITCRATREMTSSKGTFQTVDLSNVKTFLPVYDRDRGSFVATYKKTNDLAICWLRNLELAQADELISPNLAQDLRSEFKQFQTTYETATKGFLINGLSEPALLEQLRFYTKLLMVICRYAKGDRNREYLLRPLLQLGTVAIEGGSTMAVVAPWQPLRMAAMAVKANLIAKFIKYLLTTDEVFFGDTRLFFNDMKEELSHPFYPELVVGWHENKAELLSVTDVVGDYSLHESPLISSEGIDDTNENPTEAANRVVELVDRYLALHPHEQANLSVVLYNCDSARLPQAVVDKIGVTREDDEDVRCQVIIRHRDNKRLRFLYEKIIEASDVDVDSFNASEATRDFMARLRIGIMADQAPIPDQKDGRPNDISFSQDVIARHSRIEWYPENARPIELLDHIPYRWSRRRPAAKDDMKSVVYLCCPVQSREGWAFLTAVTSFLKGDWDEKTNWRLLPARQLDFQDPTTAAIFKETHDLANWVVNYDELLDRRQLLNQHVRVIRYKQSTTQGRNMVISSKAPLGLLQSMVLRRLKDLNLGLTNDEYRSLAERFIEDANSISGDIVLRAAKRGRNASELIGIVLSKFLIRHEVGSRRHFGWYFLDDYADWLGQREEQLADILMLSPEPSQNGLLRLVAIVSEAKYIDAGSLAVKRKESQNQLRHTVNRIREAIFGNPKRIDRELWLARLSDLILDGIQIPANSNLNLSDWRRAIREGQCEIHLRGYSHVFISGPNDAPSSSDFAAVTNTSDSYQEIFDRAQVRELVLQYVADRDPMGIRLANADMNIWGNQDYSFPVERPGSVFHIEEHSLPIPVLSETILKGQSGVVRATPNDDSPSVHNHSDNTQGQVNESFSSVSNTPALDPHQNQGYWAYSRIPDLISTGHIIEKTSPADEEWLSQTISRTKGALQQFQLQSKLLTSSLTPNAALLKFAGGPSLTVDMVLKRRSEFLTTHGLNIISVRPEPGSITLSIARPTRQMISLQELWSRWKPDSHNGNQELLIGLREDTGDLLFLAPAKPHAPHTLIAGATGSGKSVLMQNIILGIAATNTPAQAEIILIDPKQGVDYFPFEGLPHLQKGIVDQQDKALEMLRALVEEMESRYTRFRALRVSNLDAFNERVQQADRLPYLWLIHDEFADWMMVEEYKQEVVSVVGRLGVKARAAGIYLIFAAQRPDANVMPVQLRDNLGNRLILKVASEGTSEIALGEKGAERLLGRGHLIAKLEGVSDVSYGQVPFVDAEDIEKLVSLIRH